MTKSPIDNDSIYEAVQKIADKVEKIEDMLKQRSWPSEVCPNCGSHNVTSGVHRENKMVNASGQAVMRNHHCDDCSQEWKRLIALT